MVTGSNLPEAAEIMIASSAATLANISECETG